jgi:hypothetical protein
MAVHLKPSPAGWLAFEQNVLHRLSFESVAMPLTAGTGLGVYLKRRGVRVAANDPLQSSWVAAMARLQNDRETLSTDDVNVVLEDAYVPGWKLDNPALSRWFSETDAWWFDNVRRNIEKLSSPVARSIAGSLAVETGRYVMSFDEATRQFRQPLSNAFRRLWSIEPDPSPGLAYCSNKPVDAFLADPQVMERFGDLLFLRLPALSSRGLRGTLGRDAWAEEWIRGGDNFWPILEESSSRSLGGATETRSQYLRLLERTLERAGNFKKWAIAHVEGGFVTTQDIVETIGALRRVETIYTKDFSELTGTKAVIVVA